MLYALVIFAQEGKEAGKSGGFFGDPMSFLPILLVILMLYFVIVVLPGRRRADKERQESMNKMEKGTEVLTIGGIYGTVISVHPEKDEIVVKVDDGTRLRMTKGSISRNLTAEEAARKAKETKTAPAPAAAATNAITTAPAETPKK